MSRSVFLFFNLTGEDFSGEIIRQPCSTILLDNLNLFDNITHSEIK